MMKNNMKVSRILKNNEEVSKIIKNNNKEANRHFTK